MLKLNLGESNQCAQLITSATILIQAATIARCVVSYCVRNEIPCTKIDVRHDRCLHLMSLPVDLIAPLYFPMEQSMHFIPSCMTYVTGLCGRSCNSRRSSSRRAAETGDVPCRQLSFQAWTDQCSCSDKLHLLHFALDSARRCSDWLNKLLDQSGELLLSFLCVQIE